MSLNNLLAKIGIDSTVFLAASTGLLYVTGGYYQSGYLQKWGVESDFFASDIYGNLVSGTIVLSVSMRSISINVIICGVIALLCAAVVISLLKGGAARNIDSEKEAKPESEPPKLLMYLANIALKSIVIGWLLLAMLYAFHRLIIFSSEQGEKQAAKEYEQYSQGNAQGDQKGLFSKLRTYCIDGAQRNALLLATDRSTYALYFPKTKTAQESVEIIAAARINGISAAKNGSSLASLPGSCPPVASAASSSARP